MFLEVKKILIFSGISSGCKDSLIRVFALQTNQRLFVLKGHEKPVTSLSFLTFSDDDTNSSNTSSFLISGSWDGTAKIWNLMNGVCCATLDAHENTVSVQALPPPPPSSSSSENDVKARFATGSAGIAVGNTISEHKIRIYEASLPKSSSSSSQMSVTLQSTVANDHHGPIRSLSFDQRLQLIISCSNDGSVKLRDVQTGTCIQTLSFPMNYQDDELGINFQVVQQQPPMLLDVCTNHSDSIVACGEDGTVIIWSNDETNEETTQQTQIIPHPNCVWKVLTLPNHDIVTACHDGMIRIFTRNNDRVANDDIIQSVF